MPLVFEDDPKPPVVVPPLFPPVDSLFRLNLNDLDALLYRIEGYEAAVHRQRDELISSTTVVSCTSNNYGKGCGTSYPIGKLTYIQTQWYVRPYSCNGGDYWKDGEGRFRCPTCGHLNRLYDRKEIEGMKRWFKDSVVEKDRD